MTGDIVCLLLGSITPILLRPHQNGIYRVVGESYIHGLMDTEGLLGPLPTGWRLHRAWDFGPRPVQAQVFTNTETGVVICEDPRLGALPDEWEYAGEYDPVRTARPEFRHVETQQVTRSDPRLLPEILKKRGVGVKSFLFI
jgi:hypothetical protein